MRDWNDEVADWDEWRYKDYFKWVKETYGKEEVAKGFIHADEYRAVMDVKNSVIPETNPYIDALAHSMLHTKEVLAAGIMNKIFDEVYEEHGKALLNDSR